MNAPEPNPMVVQQRVRNRIIEVLQDFASFDRQRDYASKVPYISVPNELLEEWRGWFEPCRFAPPVFNRHERGAAERFNSAWSAVVETFDWDSPSLESVQAKDQWKDLRDEAQLALAMFLARGKLSEDEPMTQAS